MFTFLEVHQSSMRSLENHQYETLMPVFFLSFSAFFPLRLLFYLHLIQCFQKPPFYHDHQKYLNSIGLKTSL